MEENIRETLFAVFRDFLSEIIESLSPRLQEYVQNSGTCVDISRLMVAYGL